MKGRNSERHAGGIKYSFTFILAALLFLAFTSDNAGAEKIYKNTNENSNQEVSQSKPDNHALKAPPIANLITGLKQRLQTKPHDPESWQLLIKSYEHLNRVDAAAWARQQAKKYSNADTPAVDPFQQLLGPAINASDER